MVLLHHQPLVAMELLTLEAVAVVALTQVLVELAAPASSSCPTP
jgi:hypothetical protein